MRNNFELVSVTVGYEMGSIDPVDFITALDRVELAFGDKTRKEIRERAGNRSEVSGRDDMPLEASHIRHGRGKEEQQASNGILLTVAEHLMYHFLHKDNPEKINLTREQNDWAIHQIYLRLVNFILGRGGDLTDVSRELRTAQRDMEDWLK